jgi:RNA binding exosome subunit
MEGFFGNALKTAAWMGDHRMAALMIDLGADVNTQGGYYGNALQVASWRASWTGNDDILELLFRADANVNAEGGYFGNALQAAAWGGKPHTMRLLLDSGAQPTAQGG